MTRARALIAALTVLAVGCNWVFDIEDVVLRESEAAGGAGAGGAGASETGGGGHAEGGGGQAPDRFQCGDPDFDDGLVDDGSAEIGWPQQSSGIDFNYTETDPCDGDYALTIVGEGAPTAEAPPASLFTTGEIGTVAVRGCVMSRIAARLEDGTAPRFWARMLVKDERQVERWANTITPEDGFTVTSADWAFFEHTCRLTFPAGTLDAQSFFEVFVEAGARIGFDAFQVFAVECEDATPECTANEL